MNFSVNLILDKFPVLGVYKRLLLAVIDTYLPTKPTYSQHGEDEYISNRLQEYDLKSGIYIDVGSNHPTTISNTYLFYRQGFSGIAIEPNSELAKLHRKFRRSDIVLNIGCDNQSKLGKLEVSKAPVLSHFKLENDDISNQLGFQLWRIEYVPILPLNLILDSISHEWIFLLSIDVEGLDYEVLEGSDEILLKVLFCCVEVNSEIESNKVSVFMSDKGFVLDKKMGCNVIFKNTVSSFTQYKNSFCPFTT